MGLNKNYTFYFIVGFDANKINLWNGSCFTSISIIQFHKLHLKLQFWYLINQDTQATCKMEPLVLKDFNLSNHCSIHCDFTCMIHVTCEVDDMKKNSTMLSKILFTWQEQAITKGIHQILKTSQLRTFQTYYSKGFFFSYLTSKIVNIT